MIGRALRGTLKEPLRDTFLHRWLNALRLRREVARWERSGRPVPPPHLIKQRTVKEYAARFGTRVMIETGTYTGAMVHATRGLFQRIVSIEVERSLHEKAVRRFAKSPHIELRLGDSEIELPKVLDCLQEPALFWLDGHFSAGVTSRGRLETPILQELEAVLRHPVAGHVILVDDAREFTGQRDYPTLAELRTLVLERRPGFTFEVEDDIIRIHPPVTPGSMGAD